jgi:uncharacterized protein YndB with AHSA1/START domain
MAVTAVRRDLDRLTLSVDAEFDAPPVRVWELWADPRQLERWWGPPSYPATITAHDLRIGGRVEYHLTGPAGDQPHGYWVIVEADAPGRLAFRDGLANADGSPSTAVPGHEVEVRITELGGGRTRMSIESTFPDTAAMEQMLAMGMEQGLTQAVEQIDAILAEDAAATSAAR